MFAGEGRTVRLSKRRMKVRKVLTSPWSEQCRCCRSQSARIFLEQKNSDTAEANLIAESTVKQDAPAPCAEKVSERTKICMAVDSGACEGVIDAAGHVPGYGVRKALVYALATSFCR